jgi:hypothetical protein
MGAAVTMSQLSRNDTSGTRTDNCDPVAMSAPFAARRHGRAEGNARLQAGTVKLPGEWAAV